MVCLRYVHQSGVQHQPGMVAGGASELPSEPSGGPMDDRRIDRADCPILALELAYAPAPDHECPPGFACGSIPMAGPLCLWFMADPFPGLFHALSLDSDDARP